MSSVADHYDRLLGPIYRWMIGDVAAATARGRSELQAAGIKPGTAGLAVDLGAGLGIHTIPLAEAGFSVIALETCPTLALELREQAGSALVRVVEDDLLNFRGHCGGPADAILCMGDTLTHLASKEAVGELVDEVAAALASPGCFVATFRDYAMAESRGTARFIPVRSDPSRIMTCFLEYSDEIVNVHDILHEQGEGGWRMRVSTYPKLRLDPAWVANQFGRAGLSAELGDAPGGMVRLVARRP